MKTPVRVRFAPSPTGAQHIGGIRTAAYNYFFAKKHGGQFVLRIEDTDQKRFVTGSEAYIRTTLEWLGITPDESPWHGGPHGPYRQSERKTLYREYALALVAKGAAYYAFDTVQELEAMRALQKKQGIQSPKYNAVTRMSMKNSFTLPAEEGAARIADGRPYVIRLRVDYQETIKFRDEIRGWIQVQGNTMDDKVLLKEDGMPTYHLANVVDDHLMGITHVIRGEEWLPSTPSHVKMYAALGWESPVFAHLPLLLRTDGKGKLSKRMAEKTGTLVFPLQWQDPATKVVYAGFREKGFLPEALLNFIALLGWHPPGDQEVLSKEALCKAFVLNKVNKAGVRVDIQKAIWFNAQHIRALPNEVLATRYLLPLLQEHHLPQNKAYATVLCGLVKERVHFPADVWEQHTYCFIPPTRYPMKLVAKKWSVEKGRALHTLLTSWRALRRWDKTVIGECIQAAREKEEVTQGQLMPLLRVAVTGVTSGPELLALLLLIGQAATCQRLEDALMFWESK